MNNGYTETEQIAMNKIVYMLTPKITDAIEDVLKDAPLDDYGINGPAMSGSALCSLVNAAMSIALAIVDVDNVDAVNAFKEQIIAIIDAKIEHKDDHAPVEA